MLNFATSLFLRVLVRSGMFLQKLIGVFRRVQARFSAPDHPHAVPVTRPSFPLETMRLCVVIPAYNEEQTIGSTLDSVLNTGVSPQNIFVIDDCSGDHTSQIVEGYGVNLLRNRTNAGKAESIKRAAFSQRLTERFDLIALLDADTIVHRDYFSRIHSHAIAHRDVALFVGQVKSRRHNWLTSSRALDYTYMHDVYKTAQSKYSMITVAPGCASVYRAHAFRQLDISNDTLAEDMDWTIQVHRKGLGKTQYVAGAIVYTQDPETLRDYTRQILRWYTGYWQVIRKHRIPLSPTRIDLEIGLLYLEGLTYGIVLMLLVPLLPFLLVFHRPWIATLAFYDLMAFSCIVIYSTIRNRRLDIIGYFPLFYIVRFLNAQYFLYSFLRIYLKPEEVRTWNMVKRYQSR